MNDLPLTAKVAREIQATVRPLLSAPDTVITMSEVIKDKGNEHTAHRIDSVAEGILFEALRREGFAGRVFSEESGLVVMGDEPRLIISDPYCNTTLTFRGVRESAIAVYEYEANGRFVSGAIADVQIPRIAWVADAQGTFSTYFVPKIQTNVAAKSEVKTVDDAFLAIALMKRNRRTQIPLKLLRSVKLMSAVDGAIVALRIIIGELDGFVDVAVGQPTYETMAYALVAESGGTVCDASGSPIDFSRLARGLWDGAVSRHVVIAACSRPLSESILGHLAE